VRARADAPDLTRREPRLHDVTNPTFASRIPAARRARRRGRNRRAHDGYRLAFGAGAICAFAAASLAALLNPLRAPKAAGPATKTAAKAVS
jgi:hypothetical protein